MKKRRIKHNNLAPWFLEDHDALPASYLKSCQKFFNELKLSSGEGGRVGPKATSTQAKKNVDRQQAT
tara:strand:- start:228 stop:428 length:201 start_codon:yes stop_codon:yes gene_type:complete